MPAADRRDTQEKAFLNHMADKEHQPLPGRSHHAGPLPRREKKLHEAVCVLLVELCERFTFFGIVCNMILFCTAKLGYRSYQAAMVNMCFVGTSTLSPVLLGWLAEHLVGRTRLVCICMFLHFLGGSQPASLFPNSLAEMLCVGICFPQPSLTPLFSAPPLQNARQSFHLCFLSDFKKTKPHWCVRLVLKLGSWVSCWQSGCSSLRTGP